MSNESQKTLNEWVLELSAVDAELEQSANRILENCETLVTMADTSSDVQNIAMAIMENCSFHDLNSQRLRKIIKGVGQLMQSQGIETLQFQGSDIAPGIASGPQREGIALTQSDIENLMKG
ncbi:MAG: hypothetical protein K2X98_03745 [Alphaproteobacteria bacterium]|nr:hypothetical protein [Alphaproteobacteria bacterium]